jgi:hypothetical protein
MNKNEPFAALVGGRWIVAYFAVGVNPILIRAGSSITYHSAHKPDCLVT